MHDVTVRLAHSAGLYSPHLIIIIVGLLLLGMGLTIGTFVSLAARIRDLAERLITCDTCGTVFDAPDGFTAEQWRAYLPGSIPVLCPECVTATARRLLAEHDDQDGGRR
jgi:hypothetical protein